MSLITIVAISGLLAGALGAQQGVIEGQVINGSAGNVPVGGAEVVLRVDDGQGMVPVAQTRADAQGRFMFEGLPLGRHYVYLPGANHGGIHYPGPRCWLTAQEPRCRIGVQVFDTRVGPSPLVCRSHSVVVRIEEHALEVREQLEIDNPTRTTYVGSDTQDGNSETMSLSIPSGFEKVTFDKEFFGRRFKLNAGRLTTTIPWTPGRRQLAFTYWLPVTSRTMSWQRPLDLPTQQFRLQLATGPTWTGQVQCNLPAAPEQHTWAYLADGTRQALAAGHVVHLRLGALGSPLVGPLRWLAVVLLLLLVAGLVLPRRRHALRPKRQPVGNEQRSAARKS